MFDGFDNFPTLLSEFSWVFLGGGDDPAGAPELRVENPRISGARNSKSVKTPENRHPKTPALGRLRLRFNGAFSGANFRVF